MRAYRLEHRTDGRGPFVRLDLDFEGFRQVYPGTRFRGSIGSRKGWCEEMGARGCKSAFRDPWAVWCYFHQQLAELHALGYVVAEYDAAVLREDHTSQCLIPVHVQPVRVVRALDLPLVAA